MHKTITILSVNMTFLVEIMHLKVIVIDFFAKFIFKYVFINFYSSFEL